MKTDKDRAHDAKISSIVSQINTITNSYSIELKKSINNQTNPENLKTKITNDTKTALQELIDNRIIEKNKDDRDKSTSLSSEEKEFLTNIIGEISNNLVEISKDSSKVKGFTEKINELRNRNPTVKVQTSVERTSENVKNKAAKELSNILGNHTVGQNHQRQNQPIQNHAGQAITTGLVEVQHSTWRIVKALEKLCITFGKCMDAIDRSSMRRKENKEYNKTIAQNKKSDVKEDQSLISERKKEDLAYKQNIDQHSSNFSQNDGEKKVIALKGIMELSLLKQGAIEARTQEDGTKKTERWQRDNSAKVSHNIEMKNVDQHRTHQKRWEESVTNRQQKPPVTGRG